jgi:hypothetical protein
MAQLQELILPDPEATPQELGFSEAGEIMPGVDVPRNPSASYTLTPRVAVVKKSCANLTSDCLLSE